MVQSFETFFLEGHRALSSGNAEGAYNQWLHCLQHPRIATFDHRRLANAFRTIGHITEAAQLVAEALERSPEDLDLLADQASLLLDTGNSEKAFECFYNLAQLSLAAGRIEQSLSFHGHALMAMEYAASLPYQYKKALAIRWGELATSWCKNQTQTQNLPAWMPKLNPTRPHRVGFLSGDLCDHPVGFLLLPLLQHRSNDQWEPFVYDNGSRVDNTHRQLRATVKNEHWHPLQQTNDTSVAKLILADQLDVLIDLSGHTGRNRLRLLGHRLAGKQLTWLGYSGTSGLSTMDGIILDETLSHNTADQFVEPILKLEPSRFCFRPPFSPQIKMPPCTEKGYITFGSFNNTAKYSPRLLKVWADILKQVPKSRLVLKWRTFADKAFCTTIHNTFESDGIEPGRIELRSFSTHRAMLDEYNDIDIALDTFPFNGGYTSLESLWMGIPLVTLRGQSPIERQSASFLNAIGNASWIAQDINAYTATALKFAGNLADLITYRQSLRFQIMGSHLYDAPRFANQFASMLDALKSSHP